jgi:predicted Zn-dependent protease
VKRAASALAALAAATVALAQQTTPPTPAEQRTSPAPQEQTTPPANSSARSLSEADKQTLMNKCLTQVQAANPNVPQKDIRAYCDQEIKSIASPR